MSGTTWSKFFWSDWRSDEGLKLCSYAARGLWMDLLSIAATSGETGYVCIAGRPLNAAEIAKMTGGGRDEVEALLAELEGYGVFSRDERGCIFSRRMVKDGKRSEAARDHGRQGGNPALKGRATGPVKPEDKATCKDVVNPPRDDEVKGLVKGEANLILGPMDISQKPEARSQDTSVSSLRSETSERANGSPKARRADVDRIWELSPHVSRQRSSRGDVERALNAAIRRGRLVDEIVVGLTAYFESDGAMKDSGAFAKGVHRMIENDRWLEFLEADEPDDGQIRHPSEDRQRFWAKDWREHPNQWRDYERGPPPGQPGCRIAPEILAEFGLLAERAA